MSPDPNQRIDELRAHLDRIEGGDEDFASKVVAEIERRSLVQNGTELLLEGGAAIVLSQLDLLWALLGSGEEDANRERNLG